MLSTRVAPAGEMSFERAWAACMTALSSEGLERRVIRGNGNQTRLVLAVLLDKMPHPPHVTHLIFTYLIVMP